MRPDHIKTEAIGIGTIMASLWRRKLLLVFCVLVCFGAALALTAVLPPRYTASVSILLDPKGPDGSDGEFTSRPVDTAKIGSVVSVIQSNELLNSVVQEQHLVDDPEFIPQPTLIARLMQLVTSQASAPADPSPAAKVARATDALRNVMMITRDGFTYVIKIDVSSRDPAKARRLAQAVADTYLSKQIEAKEDTTNRNLKWLTERLKELSDEQMKSEAAVETVRRTFGLAETDGGLTPIATVQINDLGKEIVLAQADLSQKKARADLVDQLQASGADLQSFPEVAGSAVITQLRQRLAEAISKLGEQTQLYGTKHPAVIQAENDRQSIEAQISAEVTRIITNIRHEYEAGLQRQQALQDQLTRLKDDEGGGAEGRSRLRQAQRLAQANRQLFDLTLTRYKEVEQKQTLREAEARVISAAVLPTAPSFPKPTLFLLGGLVSGLLLGGGLALLLENTDRTFSTPSQIEDQLGLPVLATVPQIERKHLPRGDRAALIGYTAMNPLSLWAESLRTIRTSLCEQPTKRARVIQFTSPMPNEGKSTLAASVGVSAAMAGMRTILIDCDFRNPTATHAFNCRTHVGVSDYLLGSASLADTIVPTATPLLSLIPAGTNAAALPDLSNLDSMMKLVLEAVENADLVIVDSAAVEVVADATMIAQAVDRTVMVVKWRSSDRTVVTRALDRITRANGRVAGVVLNGVDLKSVAQYGYVSRAHMKQIGKYYQVAEPGRGAGRPIQALLRHSTAATVTLASLTTILSVATLH